MQNKAVGIGDLQPVAWRKEPPAWSSDGGEPSTLKDDATPQISNPSFTTACSHTIEVYDLC